MVRPLFWVKAVTGMRSREQRPAQERWAAMGPVNCACVRQLLTLTAQWRNRWSEMPASYLCAERNASVDNSSGDGGLGELLLSGGARSRWVDMRAAFDGTSRSYHFSRSRELVTADAAEAAFGGQLLPLSACPGNCRNGWCLAQRGLPVCRCFHDAVRSSTKNGGVPTPYRPHTDGVAASHACGPAACAGPVPLPAHFHVPYLAF